MGRVLAEERIRGRPPMITTCDFCGNDLGESVAAAGIERYRQTHDGREPGDDAIRVCHECLATLRQALELAWKVEMAKWN